MRAVACKSRLRSAFVGVSKGAGIVFGSLINSVSRNNGNVLFLNVWFLFFQTNLLLARTTPSFSPSPYISLGLTLLMAAAAIVHAVMYNFSSTALLYLYTWLSNRSRILLVYLAALGFLGYFIGPSFFFVSLLHFRTLFGDAAKNLMEMGAWEANFPYGDLELGFIDVAGVCVLFQGFFISSSGLTLLLQDSMFISLAFIIIFPFCLGTGVFAEGMLMSVGFPLFQLPSFLPKDLPTIVKELDKGVVTKHPNLEKLFAKQPKSFFHYFFKGPDSTKFVITPPHDDFVAAHAEVARKVRGYLLNERAVNVAEFTGSTEQFIKQMELSGRKPTPTECMLYYELVTRVSVYGMFVDPKTGYPCYDISPEYRASIFLNDTQFRSDPSKVLSSTRVLVNSGNEVFAVSGHYIKTGEFLIRPELSGFGKHPDVLKTPGGLFEIKTFSGPTTAAKVENIVGSPHSNTFGRLPLVLSARNFDYIGPHVDSTILDSLFTEKSLPKSNIITDILNESRQLNNPRGQRTSATGVSE